MSSIFSEVLCLPDPVSAVVEMPSFHCWSMNDAVLSDAYADTLGRPSIPLQPLWPTICYIKRPYHTPTSPLGSSVAPLSRLRPSIFHLQQSPCSSSGASPMWPLIMLALFFCAIHIISLVWLAWHAFISSQLDHFVCKKGNKRGN